MTVQPLYTTAILRLAASLAEPRALEREDGRAEVRSPTCGSRVSTTVQLDGEGRVAALSQQVHACAFGQASAALVEQAAIDMTRGEAEQRLAAAEAWLSGAGDPPRGLDVLAPARNRSARHGAILLPFRALLAAIEDAA